MELWFTEDQTPEMRISCRVKEVLYRGKSTYQEILVLDTFQFGRMLVLDDIIQTTERDEFVYHEMIVHPALVAHPKPERVLVVGGGDGGTVREVLKHTSVQEVVLAEIDEKVVEVARRFLPTISSGLDDPRVKVDIGDGIKHVKGVRGAYDVIIVDSTDPIGPAVGLFSEDFYRSVREALRPEGLLVAQTESPFFNSTLVQQVQRTVAGLFPVTTLHLASVPTYPGGLWSFTIGSKVVDPRNPGQERLEMAAGLETRYYSPEVQHQAFVLPPFVAELVQGGDAG